MTSERIDLGHNHFLEYTCWNPDDLPRNRELYGYPLPNIQRSGAIIYHPNLKTGGECMSGIHFDVQGMRPHWDNRQLWKVEQLEPLTLSPSILCLGCGDHGFIRNGVWVTA